MKEAEDFLKAREEGVSRPVASRPLTEQCREVRVGKWLEKKLEIAVNRAKAIWPGAAELTLKPLEWIQMACGATERPLVVMNAFALDHGVNAICFCRASILFFRPRLSHHGASHNMGSVGSKGLLIGYWPHSMQGGP
jgi:hypothetical protein